MAKTNKDRLQNLILNWGKNENPEDDEPTAAEIREEKLRLFAECGYVITPEFSCDRLLENVRLMREATGGGNESHKIAPADFKKAAAGGK